MSKFETKLVEAKDVVTIRRYPFRRFDTIRTLSDNGKKCVNCNRPGRFHYGAGDEGPLVYTENFCSIGCYRSFYGCNIWYPKRFDR